MVILKKKLGLNSTSKIKLTTTTNLTKKLILTLANWSNRPNSSFNSLTNSCAVHWEARTVNPTISANKILQQIEKHEGYIIRIKILISVSLLAIIKCKGTWKIFQCITRPKQILFIIRHNAWMIVQRALRIYKGLFMPNWVLIAIQMLFRVLLYKCFVSTLNL